MSTTASSGVWKPGDVVLSLYQVGDKLGAGATGVVHRVSHLEWGIDLAVKSPRKEIQSSVDGLQLFILEAENWVQLGLHPNVVCCHYVRVADGVPRVFMEYVTGGDLRDWLVSRRFYQQEGREVLEASLDVAIQSAWGLAFAHQMGLTHGDVKPGNMLLGAEGGLKITDFGLSRSLATMPLLASDTGSSMHPSTAYTPAYTSPEQAAGLQWTPRTDIWSWAVSILEIFVGHPPSWGPVAHKLLQDYLKKGSTYAGCPPMPEKLAALLGHCLREKVSERPADFEEVIAHLLDIYRTECGRDYPRVRPDHARLMGDALNNRGVSLLDLGRTPEAVTMLEEALRVDAHHLQASYNLVVLHWRSGRLTDDQALSAVKALGNVHGRHSDIALFLTNLHLERGDVESARRALQEAERLGVSTDAVLKSPSWTTADGNRLNVVFKHACHQTAIHSIALSTGGRWLMTASLAEGVRVWETPTGKVYRHFAVAAATAACSADGRYVYIGLSHGEVAVYDCANGARIALLKGHEQSVCAVAAERAGSLTVTGGQDGTVRLWETVSGRCVRLLRHDGGVRSIASADDGRRVLAGLESGQCRVWDTSKSECISVLTGHTGAITGAFLSTDGTVAVTSSMDGVVKVWSVADGKLRRTLQGHQGSVLSLAVQPHAAMAATGGEDGTLRLWDLASGRCWRTEGLKAGWVHSVCLSQDPLAVAAGNADGVAWVARFAAPAPLATPALSRPQAVSQMLTVQSDYQAKLDGVEAHLQQGDLDAALAQFATVRSLPGFERSPDNLRVSAVLSRAARPARLLNAWPLSDLEPHEGKTTGVVCDPGGTVAVSAGSDGLIKVWDIADCRLRAAYKVQPAAVRTMAVSRNGRWLFCGAGTTVQVWDLVDGNEATRLPDQRQPVVALAINGDGRYAAVVGQDSKCTLWDLSRGAEVVRILDGQGEALALSGDGDWLAWGSFGGTSRVWQMSTSSPATVLRGHEGPVRCIGMSADGSLILSGGEDKTVRVWGGPQRSALRLLRGHARAVTCLAMVPTGTTAVTGSKDKTVKIWNLDSGDLLTTLSGHAEAVTSVGLSADGRYCVSGGSDGSVRLWYLDWELVPWTAAERDARVRIWLLESLRLHPDAWSESDLQELAWTLQSSGLGWYAPDDLHDRLVALTHEPPG